jgi:hypothetical protein
MIRYALPVRPILGDYNYLYSNFRALAMSPILSLLLLLFFLRLHVPLRFVCCSLMQIVVSQHAAVNVTAGYIHTACSEKTALLVWYVYSVTRWLDNLK